MRCAAIAVLFLFVCACGGAWAFDWIAVHDAARSATQAAEQSDGQVSNEELYSAALALLEAYRHDEAAVFFRRLLERDPSSPEAAWGLAECARRDSDFDAAWPLLEQVMRKKPDFAPAYVSAAYIEFLRRHFAQSAELSYVVIRRGRAKSDLASLVRAYSMHAGARGMLAHFGGPLAKTVHGGMVLRNLKAAERLDPDSPAVHFGFGCYYLLLPSFMGRDLDAAVDRFRKALAADPLFADAHVRLAQAYKARGDAAGYEAELRRALELDPKNVLARDVRDGRCGFICP